MLIATLVTASVAALAVATPNGANHQKRQIPYSDVAEWAPIASEFGVTALPSNPAQLASLESAVAALTSILPPASILRVLATAVPTSVIHDLADPVSASAFANDFLNGQIPDWYRALPQNVQYFFTTFSPTLPPEATPTPEASAESVIQTMAASEESAAETAAPTSTFSTGLTTSSSTSASSPTRTSTSAPDSAAAPVLSLSFATLLIAAAGVLVLTTAF